MNKKKLQTLIEDLTKIVNVMNSLEDRTKECKTLLKENVIIDRETYQEDNYEKIEKTTKNISNNLKNRIIPNLKNEMDQQYGGIL